MSGGQQLDLIPREVPKTLLASLEAKLPQREHISVSDVAIAANVSVTLVYAWIEEGLIEAVNIGTGGKNFWKVYRPSVVAFYRKRLGMEP